MKAYFQILMVGIFLLTPVLTFAQSSSSALSGVDFSKDRVQQFRSVASNNLVNTSTTMLQQNQAVFVQQIGQYNQIQSNTRAAFSDMTYYQNGNRNNIQSNVTAVAVKETVLQDGVRNGFFSINGPTITHRSAVIQQGSDQNLYWIGSNSISERMLVNMKGSQQTIIVRNIR